MRRTHFCAAFVVSILIIIYLIPKDIAHHFLQFITLGLIATKSALGQKQTE